MITQRQFGLLMGLAALALALALTDIILFNGNQQAQNEFNVRAQYVQQSMQIEPVYQGIVRGLVELAAKNNDQQIRNLLAAQGISFTLNSAQGKGK